MVKVRPRPDAVASPGSPDFHLLPKDLRERLESMPPEEEHGSGIILRSDGFILTNGHVIEDAGDIEISLLDGRQYRAEVRGVDTESDLAVIKVEAANLPAARLGDSSKVHVGEFAIAIGAPFELDYTVTFGHVSAKGRRVLTDAFMMDQDFIQTDASINPGNSGGPLVNIESEVIGINTMIHGLNTGIGFAVPINLAREVSDQLIEKGHFTRAWLGVQIAALGKHLRTKPEDVPVEEGVLVTRVLPDGPSSGSDLHPQDVIVTVAGVPIHDDVDLRRQISRRPIHEPVSVEVYRGKARLELRLTPGPLPENRWSSLRRSPPPSENDGDLDGLGVRVRELDDSNARRLGIPLESGVLVVDVTPGSPADRRQIRPGEAITRINRRPIRTPNDFRDAVSDADLKRGVDVTVVGDAGRRFEVLKEDTR